MKNLTKILALLLALCMVFALAACGSSEKDAAEDAKDAAEEAVEEVEEAAEDAAEAAEEAVEDAEEAVEEVAEDAEEAVEEAVEDAEEAIEEAAEEATEAAEEAVEEAEEAVEEAAADDGNSITVDVVADPAAGALEGKTIGYVTITSTAPWGGRVGTEFQRIAEEAGATVLVGDAQTDVAQVAEYCNNMIERGVDALAVFGGDPAANAEIAKAADEAGIPMFMTALDVAEEGRQYVKACVGPDQEQMCYDIAQYIIEANGADSGMKVVQISGVPFLDDYIQREAGFARAMAETNYEVLPADYAYSSRTDAKTFMENHITAEGDSINIVMGFDDDLTMGAVAAIEEAGLTEQIKVYSLTGQNDAIQAVADGKLELTVMNRADDIAKEAVNAVIEYFETGSTPYYHYTPLTFIDASNVADFIGQGEF